MDDKLHDKIEAYFNKQLVKYGILVIIGAFSVTTFVWLIIGNYNDRTNEKFNILSHGVQEVKEIALDTKSEVKANNSLIIQRVSDIEEKVKEIEGKK